MVEYALVVALIATVCIVGFTRLGSSINANVGKAGGVVDAAAQIGDKISTNLATNVTNAANGNTSNITAESFGL